MSHDDVFTALQYLYPDTPFSYDGDGSTLDPVDGAAGLIWLADPPATLPTLDTVQAAVTDAQNAAALAEIRVKRDGMLAACDWTQMPDSPLADATKTAWATYRQQLRDYPDQTGFDPLNPPAWPTPPA